MPDSQLTPRQYAGLAFLLIAFVGGIIGWSWAVLTVDSEPAAPDSVQARTGGPPAVASGGTGNDRSHGGIRSPRSNDLSTAPGEALSFQFSTDQ